MTLISVYEDETQIILQTYSNHFVSVFCTFLFCRVKYISNSIMLCFQIDFEESFDPNKLPIYPKPCDDKPRNLPEIKEEVVPEPKLNIPVIVEKKTVKTVSMMSKTSF